MSQASTGVFVAALVALSGALVPGEASARGWPRPAAGVSRSGDPEVIFTFDDGPHEKWSGQILDTLAAHRVSAIFYWVGHRIENGRRGQQRRRKLVDRAIRDGHLIGNHTVNHRHLCHAKTDAATEIDHNDLLYRGLAALPIVMFRAPYGDKCRRLVTLLGDRGLTHMHWDIDPREYNGLTAELTAQYVIGKLKRLRGRAIILMHDTHAASARALPRILTWIAVENERRVKAGKRPIRILSGSDLVEESGRGPLWLWGEDVAVSARGWFGRALTSLVPGAPAGAVGQAPAPGSSVLDSPTRTATLPTP